MFNSTGIFDYDGEDGVKSPSPSKNRLSSFNLRKVNPLSVDKSAAITELILSNTIALDAVAKLQVPTPPRVSKGPDVITVLLERYNTDVESIKEENKKLKESIVDSTPLPNIEDIRLNTCPKKLVVGVERLIEEFGSEGNDSHPGHEQPAATSYIQTRQHSDADFVDDVLQSTSVVVDRAKLAEKIQKFCFRRSSEDEDSE